MVAADERVLIEKEEERREAQEEFRASMVNLGDLIREGVISGLRDLGVAAVNILDDRIVASMDQMPDGNGGGASAGAAEVV